MKESFIMYNSFYEPIKTLKNEQLGKLLRAIFNYTINNEITQDNDILVAFMFIKNQLDIDASKWEEQKQKRSEAGKKGMASRWNNKDNNVIDSYNKNNNVKSVITKITDNVNVNVNDNVNVNVNDNVNVNVNDNDINNINNIRERIRERFKKPTISEIEEYCKEKDNGIDANRFYNFYESKGWYVGKNKMKDWKACIRTWEQKNKKDTGELPSWWDKDFKKEEDEYDKLAEQYTRGYLDT